MKKFVVTLLLLVSVSVMMFADVKSTAQHDVAVEQDASAKFQANIDANQKVLDGMQDTSKYNELKDACFALKRQITAKQSRFDKSNVRTEKAALQEEITELKGQYDSAVEEFKSFADTLQ